MEELRSDIPPPSTLSLTPVEIEGESLDKDSRESESLHKNSSLCLIELEEIVKNLKVWRRNVKTVYGEEIRDYQCDCNREDLNYSYSEGRRQSDSIWALESLAAIVQEVRDGQEKPWRYRCDSNLPRDAFTKKRCEAMEDHGLLMEFKEKK